MQVSDPLIRYLESSEVVFLNIFNKSLKLIKERENI